MAVARKLFLREVPLAGCRRRVQTLVAGHRVEELVVHDGDHYLVKLGAQRHELRAEGGSLEAEHEELGHVVFYGVDVDDQRVDLGADALGAPGATPFFPAEHCLQAWNPLGPVDD